MKLKSATLTKDCTMVVLVKHLVVLSCIVFIVGIAWAQCPEKTWMHAYGGPSNEAFYAVEILDGYGYLGAGYTESSGFGGKDVFLVMTDLNGNIRWEQTYGGVNDDVANAIVVTDNHYILAGYTESMGHGGKDIHLICVDKAGTMLWKKSYGTTVDEEALAIVQDQDGGLLVTGYADSYDRNIVLLKTDKYGNKLWYQEYLLVGDAIGYDLIEITNEGYMIAGSQDILCGDNEDGIILKTDNNGEMSWLKRFDGKDIDVFRSICECPDYGYVITGYTNTNTTGNDYDVCLVRVDDDGETLWSETYGSGTDEYGYKIQNRSDNGYIICGYKKNHDRDCYLISVEDNGNMNWEKDFELAGDNVGYALKNTGSDKYLIAGYTRAHTSGSDDAFFLMLRSDIGDDVTPSMSAEPVLTFSPNPAKVHTGVDFVLENESKVSIEIFNTMGQKVTSLKNGTLHSGAHTTVWNLQNSKGHQVASGVYFVRLVVDGQESTQRLVVMH